MNVGGPHTSERRCDGLLQEFSSTGLRTIALQKVRFRKGVEWRGLKTEQVLRNCKPIAGRALGTESDNFFSPRCWPPPFTSSSLSWCACLAIFAVCTSNYVQRPIKGEVLVVA